MKNNAASVASGKCPASLASLSELEFIFVSGKGGVGKSTASALLGLVAADSGKRVLIVYPSGEGNPEKLWGQSISENPSPVAPGVDAARVNPESAMRQYLASILGSKKLANLLFHGKVARGLLNGVPGPSEWAVLGKAWSWTRFSTFRLPKGQDPYDLVILDGPSTGDSSGMLRVPQIIVDLAPAARLRVDAESCLKMLRDPTRSAVVFVTLPEEVVITETEENLDLMRRDLHLPLGPLLVNQIRSPIFSPKDRKLLEVLDESPDEERSSRCLNVARHQALRESLQQQHLKHIEALGLPLITIPHLDGPLRGLSALEKLKMGLAEGP